MYKGKGKYVRLRSVRGFLEEIKQAVAGKHVRYIYFQDDTFIINRKWLREFTALYKEEVGLPYICLVRADQVNDEAVRMLAESGCKRIFWGVESGNAETRNTLLQKKISDEDILQCAKILKKYGIRFRTYNILGFPDETLEDALRTVEMNMKIRTDFPW